jgi:hypothetical protein
MQGIRASTSKVDNNLVINIRDVPNQQAFNAIQSALGTSALSTSFIDAPTKKNPTPGVGNILANVNGAGVQLGAAGQNGVGQVQAQPQNPLVALLAQLGVGQVQAQPQNPLVALLAQLGVGQVQAQPQNPLVALLAQLGVGQVQVQQPPPQPNPLQLLASYLAQLLGIR